MSEFKGTKGNWEIVDGEITDTLFPIRISVGDKNIVEVVAYEFRHVSIEEANANAKLIAAALDLLEHELKFDKIMEEWGEKYPEIPIPMAIFEHWNEAEKLIKKILK